MRKRIYLPGYWINEDSRYYLANGYLDKGLSVEDRIIQIANTAHNIFPSIRYKDLFIDYMMKGYISLSSPVWSNYGTTKGLPIACNGSYMEDNVNSILYTTAEIGQMTKYGAGTSVYLGNIRARGENIYSGGKEVTGKADGPTHYAELINTTVNIISQSSVRRGNCAVYLPVEHPDIKEFLSIRDDGHPIQKLSLGVCITDDWLNDMINGDSSKRNIWTRIIQKRFETGYPYIFFTDNVNNNKPQVYKDKDMFISSSNLCNEVSLFADKDESFVCCLASVNLLHYDEWKDTELVKVMIWFLDTVMEEYINKTKDIPFLKRAHKFAINQRALGLGTLGYHSYLQSKMIPFESDEARNLNIEIHKKIQEDSIEESKELANMLGEPPLLKGYGIRNVTLNAIAPTTSSSFILGQVSPSIEPLNSNYFTKKLAKGNFVYRNPYLRELLEEYNKDTEEVWESILVRAGSVQHLDFLSDKEKEVFKTFYEIDQYEVIKQAGDRQKYIDQSQSLNLMISPDIALKDINNLILTAWKSGIKGLYYQRSINPAQDLSRNILTCTACEI